MADTKPLIQPQAYYPDGSPIPTDQFSKAVADGQARFEEGQRVVVRNEAGKLQTVDATDIHHPGLTILHPEEVAAIQEHKDYGKGFGNQAKAAAAGLARGATLGASDYIASKVGGEDTRKSLDALRRQNPVTSGVSEVAGAAAPLLATGGAAAPEEAALAGGAEAAEGASAASGVAGLAGSAVRTAGVIPRAVAGAGSIVERGVARGLESLGYEGTSLAGRAAAGAVKMGASGAVEGAAYGGAQAADDSILKGDDITAEKLVAGMGNGALFGGALGAGLGALGPLATGAAGKLLPSKESLEDFSRDRALKAVGRDTEKIGKDLPAAQRANLRNSVGDDLKSTLQTGENAGKPIIAAGDNAEQILGKLTQAKREVGAAFGGVKSEVNDLMVKNPELAPNMDELFQKIQTDVIDPLNATKSTGSRAQARAVERELKILRDEHEARIGAAANDNALESATPAPTFSDLDKYRQTLDANLNPKNIPKAMRGIANKNGEALEKTSRVINDYLKDKAEAALTAAGEDPSKYRELSRQYFSFSGLERAADKQVAANARNRSVSPSDHALGLAGFLAAAVTGNVGALGAMATGGAYSIANKMLRERGNSLLSVMAKRAADMDGTINEAAKSLAGHAPGIKAAGLYASMDSKDLKEQYDKTTERIRDLNRQGSDTAMNHVSSLIPEVTAHYPHVGTAVSGKLMSIFTHLGQSLPPSNTSTGDTLTPLAIKDRASVPEMRKFMSKVQGALHPEAVIKDLAAGKLDRDALDSMKIVYPQMFTQLRNAAITFTAERHDEMPYRKRLYMSLAFDFTGDSSLDPTRLQGLQQAASGAQSIDKSASSEGGSRPKTARPKTSKLGSSFALPSATAFGKPT